MKVIYSNHTPPQPGYGVFVLSDAAVPGLKSGQVQFMLKRSSDQKNLGPGGWQEAERFLQPLRIMEQDECLHLQVGPEIVDALDMREVYRFYVSWPGAANPLSAVLRVADLLYSPLSSTAAIKAAPLTPPVSAVTAAAPEEEAPARDEPLAAAGGILPQETSPSLPLPPANDSRSEEVRPDPPAAPPGSGILSSKKWLIPALVALVLVLGASLYYLWGRESSLAVPPLQQAYNHLIRENPDPEASLRLALVLQKEGSSDAYDAAFLLFENAAQKDNGRAMIFMGEYYDPLDSKPNGSIIKDSEQAFAWYNRALQMGEENAQTKLDALRKWMDEHGEE